MMDVGRYRVTDAQTYENAAPVHGDVPDEIHVHRVLDHSIRVQELWPDRGEGRFCTIALEKVDDLRTAVSPV